ncbi:MAG: UDP-glucose--hexose-1-phosphate uridylyltransferase [Planctomycetaceae bacterium]|nr:UDP-glucose--hexose-1-phosphate uridylyltransferase [Planctomycetaceae bacterium]MBQ2822675.1 UDP-glucose--hexose-1-phosphate uridylyltransferase [Thermoguttaceae bacterium]
MDILPEEHRNEPHRRFNPLRGDWVLVSPHRGKRPWLGAVEKPAPNDRPQYDPKCYLCPGNTRAEGAQNPKYESTFVFQNDFSALLKETDDSIKSPSETPLFKSESVRGECRVICFSPRHDLTLPQMEIPEIRHVIDIWTQQADELLRKYRWVQIFENKGAVMGCSNPHPHGQIWASSSLPNEPAAEEKNQKTFFEEYGKTLLSVYLEKELELQERVVTENADWAVVVPFWAVWPYETLLLPKFNAARILDLNDGQRDSLALILKEFLGIYDKLFDTSFPYSMGWHGAPGTLNENFDTAHWTLHAHFYPPLLRSATVKKFMVGYEMLGEPQRDITPEQAAERLKALK